MDRRQTKRAEVGQQKCCPPIHPLSGHHSKAVLAVTLSCKSSPPPLGVKRGCAARLACPLSSFLLNRMATGAGQGSDKINLWIRPFVPRLGSHRSKQPRYNNKASALRLDALQNDGACRMRHIYTG